MDVEVGPCLREASRAPLSLRIFVRPAFPVFGLRFSPEELSLPVFLLRWSLSLSLFWQPSFLFLVSCSQCSFEPSLVARGPQVRGREKRLKKCSSFLYSRAIESPLFPPRWWRPFFDLDRAPLRGLRIKVEFVRRTIMTFSPG